VSARKNGTEVALREAATHLKCLHLELEAAFSCGDWSHPEHRWIVKACESVVDVRDYLRVAEVLFEVDAAPHVDGGAR
jgi:hypothetical protein